MWQAAHPDFRYNSAPRAALPGMRSSSTLPMDRTYAANLRKSIVEPAAEVDEAFLTVHLVTKAGKEIQAMRVNEDTFTIQVKDPSGRFLSFDKKDLTRIEKRDKESLMPGYGDRIKGDDLDDLIAYLAGLR